MASRPPHADRPSSPPRQHHLNLVIENRPAGFFTKALAVVAAFFLLTLAFVFSLIVFAVLAAVVLVLMATVWWKRRQAWRARAVDVPHRDL